MIIIINDIISSVNHNISFECIAIGIFKPEEAHRMYHEYLDQLQFADELGFDGVCVNEHHQTAYGMMPSPIVMASILARQTKRARLLTLGYPIANRVDPVRVAEEYGDLLFVLANLARHLKLDPEAALRAANGKFSCRFKAIEAALAAKGKKPEDATLAEMEALWAAAKKTEREPV